MANHQKRSSGRQPADAAVADPNDSTPNGASDQTDGNDQTSQSAPDTNPDGTRATGKGSALNINDLKDMSIQKLTLVAKDLNVAGAT